MPGDPEFGQRMRELRQERPWTAGRKPIAEKYKRFIGAAERVFANALPAEAERYVEELEVKAPEQCPYHNGVLVCREPDCNYESHRTAYDHKAAAYVFDRVMGKPTTRSENTVTVRLVQQWTAQIATIFLEVNELDDPLTRREAFAERCDTLALLYTGNADAS